MLSMKTRLECPRSYATEDSPDLLCEVGDVKCDGTLYDCCLWDKSFSEQMEMINEVEGDGEDEADC